MGRLNLLPFSRIYLDTVVFIYTVEQAAGYQGLLANLWNQVESQNVTIFCSELIWTEILVVPLRQKNTILMDSYEALLSSPGIQLAPVTSPILKEAAQLRARVASLRTPDAIHLATAKLWDCCQFVTNDKKLRNLLDFPVVILDDIIKDA